MRPIIWALLSFAPGAEKSLPFKERNITWHVLTEQEKSMGSERYQTE